MLSKTGFISSRRSITVKYAELREIETTFIRVQKFCKLRQP